MARMSIDDKICRDPRITELAKMLGWSRREAVGCLVSEVWPVCYDQESAVVSERMIDSAAGHVGFAKAMVECELASRDRSGKLRVMGARERIEYLNHKRRAAQQGGIKSGLSRNKKSSTACASGEARGNPPDPVPVPDSASVPDPVLSEKNSARPSGGGSQPSLSGLEDAIQRNLGDVGLARAKRKPKPSEASGSELASVRVVLDKLQAQNGVQYSGTAAHTKLIVRQLRLGIPEMDLRAVIGYCAVELGWKDDEQMAKYLRPETLFGPESISKYLDPARRWLRELPAPRVQQQAESQPDGAA